MPRTAQVSLEMAHPRNVRSYLKDGFRRWGRLTDRWRAPHGKMFWEGGPVAVGALPCPSGNSSPS